MQQQCEYCELWWSEGNHPRLTFYSPAGSEIASTEQHGTRENLDNWEALQGAITELGLSGWELMSAGQHGTGLFFRRKLN